MAYATLARFKGYAPQINIYGQQTLTITGAPTGGTFKLDHNGDLTAVLNHNAAPGAVQTALRALTGLGNVLVSGERGGPWVVIDDTGGLSARLVISANSLTGGTSPTLTSSLTVEEILTEETQFIDTYVGHGWNNAAEDTRPVVGEGFSVLWPPAYVAGSISLIEGPSGITTPDYIEDNGKLIAIDAYTSGGWLADVAYEITADFGYGDPPEDIIKACLQLAVRSWQSRGAGFSDVVGVEGSSAVGYNKALPSQVKLILDAYHDAALPRKRGAGTLQLQPAYPRYWGLGIANI